MDSRSWGMLARFVKKRRDYSVYPHIILPAGHDEREIAVTLLRNVGHAFREITGHDGAKYAIGDAVDQLMRDLRAQGLKADACDCAFALEAAIYEYVKQSNPDCSLFAVSEGFGSAVDGPAGKRVIAQAKQSRDFLRSVGAIQN